MSIERGARSDRQRQATCYGCDYPRTGLAAETDCPECGAPYGAEWTIYAASPTTWETTIFAWILLLPMLGYAIPTIGSALTWTGRRGAGWEHLMMGVLGLAMVIVVFETLRHNWRQNRAARCGALALGRDEFALVDRRSRRAERYLLRDIRELEVGTTGDVVTFRYEGRKVFIDIVRVLFGHHSQAVDFAMALQKAWRDAMERG